MYWFETLAEAQMVAKALTAVRIGEPALGLYGEAADIARKVVGYNVACYRSRFDTNGIDDFGIIERWEYVDRPDLGEMGGAFVAVDTAYNLIPTDKRDQERAQAAYDAANHAAHVIYQAAAEDAMAHFRSSRYDANRFDLIDRRVVLDEAMDAAMAAYDAAMAEPLKAYVAAMASDRVRLLTRRQSV
jgi:hypothetical protein